MKVALDHHYSPVIATELAGRGHDVIAVLHREWEAEDDESLLILCHGESRALLTNNVGDFTVIARRWALEGRQHSGLIFTSDSAMRRDRSTIGRFVGALAALLGANPSEDAFAERVHWL